MSLSTAWSHTAHAQQVRFGDGVAARLRPVLQEASVRRALVLTSPGVEAAGPVIDGLGRAVVGRFDEAAAHVPVPVVRAAVQRARAESVDCLVAIGGGSVIDLAKAVAFFLEQEAGTPGVSFTDRPNFALVAVPTTLAGAEGSSRFAMTDPAARHKQGTESPTLVPRWAIYDPRLLAATPPPVIAASGMTAISHALQALLSPASPEAEALGGAALSRLYGGLAIAASEPAAAGPALEGAALAARAAQNSAPSLVQALAQLLGGRCGVGHGAAVALVLPPVLRFNGDALGNRMEQVSGLVGTADIADAMEALRAELGLPAGLSALGVGDDDIAAVARLGQQHPAWRANPRPLGEADVVALLEAAY
jgi:alcohol dehydrogenase class IV